MRQFGLQQIFIKSFMYLRNFLLGVRRFSTDNTTKQVVQTSKNLINPGPNDPIAFGYYFPRQWSQQRIYSLLDPTRKQILNVTIVQNKLGQSAGKIMFTFKNIQTMDKYISRYNQDFVQTEDSVHRVVLKRFQLKSQIKKRQRAEFNKKYGVHLTNMDFDIDQPELQRLAEDYGEIEYIDLPMKENGQNRGGARIYFKTRQASRDFKQFSDGLKYRDRRLKCSIIKSEEQLQKEKQIKQVQAPKLVMKWNEELYNRMVKLQVEQQTQSSPQNKVF